VTEAIWCDVKSLLAADPWWITNRQVDDWTFWLCI